MIFLFSSPYILFLGKFSSKIKIYDLDLIQRPHSEHSLYGKGEFDIRGDHIKEKIGARFFHYGGVSHLQQW
jgi:hypothetical protein